MSTATAEPAVAATESNAQPHDGAPGPSPSDGDPTAAFNSAVQGKLRQLWAAGVTVIKVDLVRPPPPPPLGVNRNRRQEERRQQRRRQREGDPARNVLPEEYYMMQQPDTGAGGGAADASRSAGVRAPRAIAGTRRVAYVGGQRLKLLRKWTLKSYPAEEERLNLAAGINYEVDLGRFDLVARMKSKYAGLQVLPRPQVNFRGEFPLGETGITFAAKFEVPLEERFWEQGRIGVRLHNRGARPGLHLTGAGLEFDDHVYHLASQADLRLGARLRVPRELPVPEGADSDWQLCFHRLGLRIEVD